MKNLINTTIVTIGLFIFNPMIAVAVGDNGDSLETYLKNYQPKTYNAVLESGADIQSIERSSVNTNNSEKIYLKDGEISSLSPLIPPIGPVSARKSCVRGGTTGGIFLENNYVATCVSEDGTFGNGSALLGMTFNPAGTGTVNTPDYLRPGSPHEYFSVTFNRQWFTNNNSNGAAITGSDNIPTKIRRLDRYPALQEGGAMAYSSITGRNHGQLEVTQKYTLDPNSREIIVRVEMKNTGHGLLDGITYARGLDPDQDRPLTFLTHNRKGHSYFPPFPAKAIHVKPNNIAWASGRLSKLSVALYSVDPMGHDTCISGFWTTDPFDILSQNCGVQPIYDVPAGLFGFDYSDSTINIAFKIGQLEPGETTVFSFKYLFDKARRYLTPVPVPVAPIRVLVK